MTDKDLQSRLLGSTSFQSLSSEQSILTTLKDLNWNAVHSCFYSDGKTEKLREIDVLGRRIWERKLKHRTELADLHLIVEAKSVKGFHLLFSPLNGSAAYRQANTLWLIWEDERRQILMMLSDIGLTPEQIGHVQKALEKSYTPRVPCGVATSPLTLPRPTPMSRRSGRPTSAARRIWRVQSCGEHPWRSPQRCRA